MSSATQSSQTTTSCRPKRVSSEPTAWTALTAPASPNVHSDNGPSSTNSRTKASILTSAATLQLNGSTRCGPTTATLSPSNIPPPQPSKATTPAPVNETTAAPSTTSVSPCRDTTTTSSTSSTPKPASTAS